MILVQTFLILVLILLQLPKSLFELTLLAAVITKAGRWATHNQLQSQPLVATTIKTLLIRANIFFAQFMIPAENPQN